jgi:hypothetical protein
LEAAVGFSLTWIAVRGKSRGEVLRALRLRPTGDHEELPESDFTGIDLAGGWYAVVGNGMPDQLMDGVEALSQGGESVLCLVQEHSSSSAAWHYRDGAEAWQVVHTGDQGDAFHLEVGGTPPPELAVIRSRLEKRARAEPDVDFGFDVPIELAKSVVGFRHDEVPDGDAEPFERLEPR